MAGAFQSNAFQNNAFQVGSPLTTSSSYLPYPVNAVMIGNQPYRRVERENDVRDPTIRRKVTAKASRVARLSNADPSYEVKSSSSGYV